MIIAIGGISRSGKTRLAKLLKELLNKKSVLTLCQDDYAYPVSEIPVIKDRTDWECPESINFKSLKKNLINAINIYDYVIIEGFLVFHDTDLNQYYDRSIFIEIDQATFVERRLADTRWGSEPEWYIEHIWESYQQYGQLPNLFDCMKIDGTQPIAIADLL